MLTFFNCVFTSLSFFQPFQQIAIIFILEHFCLFLVLKFMFKNPQTLVWKSANKTNKAMKRNEDWSYSLFCDVCIGGWTEWGEYGVIRVNFSLRWPHLRCSRERRLPGNHHRDDRAYKSNLHSRWQLLGKLRGLIMWVCFNLN